MKKNGFSLYQKDQSDGTYGKKTGAAPNPFNPKVSDDRDRSKHQAQVSKAFLAAGKLPSVRNTAKSAQSLTSINNSVCQSAQCPNMGECLVPGNRDPHDSRQRLHESLQLSPFKPENPPNSTWPSLPRCRCRFQNGPQALRTHFRSGDDLPDGGAKSGPPPSGPSDIATPIRPLKYWCLISRVISITSTSFWTQPNLFNHNLETVERLQKPIRKTAGYERSLSVLTHQAAGFPHQIRHNAWFG